MIDNIMIEMNWAIRFRDEVMRYPRTLEEIKWICRNKQITFFRCLYVYETTIRELMKAEKAERERRMSLIYDVFKDEYIDEAEMETSAPPERYIKITEDGEDNGTA